ncbi:substrate-binding domain-containing protein [Limnochorda pilosa]|uniref:substrate-binding domain-containing protein n=1 Tax=Limnochorda pilosa TaxID=1555112 RepID=UPI00130EA4BB|nr:substrate-binding domain-containing protein [Limnochorda pilosa]
MKVRMRVLAALVLALLIALSAGVASAASDRVVIGFSSPGADHGWLAAIQHYAREAAGRHADVQLVLTDGLNSVQKQISDVETLIARKVDVIVLLPMDGAALTPVARKVRQAGIPLVNLDRKLSEPVYDVYIGGDNYGIGRAAGEYIAQRLNGKGTVVEIQGLPGISVTEDRSRGFYDVIKQYPGIKVVASQNADFLPDRGLRVMENILQAQPKIDAVYTHDDDMAMGVVQAIRNAGRQDEMFLTGVGPLKRAMEMVKNGVAPYAATFNYSPVMAASGVELAYRIAKGRGLEELWEPTMPKEIILDATLVGPENVDQWMNLGF